MKTENTSTTRKGFPVLGILFFMIGAGWLVSELGFFEINIPWLPVTVMLAGLVMIFRR